MTVTENKKSTVQGAIVPDGGWGWVIVFSSFMIHFIMDGITYSMGDVFLHPMMDNFKAERGPVSTIFGILPAITLATGPIATIFTNTYGCRKVTIVGSCIAAAGFYLSYFFSKLWLYYVSIGVIAGIGFGLIYLPAIVSVGYYFEVKRSFAMGIAVCGSGLGTLAFPAVMPYVIGKPLSLQYEGGLLIEAAVIFVCVIFGALMVPLPQEQSEIRRVKRKARAKAKRENLEKSKNDDLNGEQKIQLIEKNQAISEKERNKDEEEETNDDNKLNNQENDSSLVVSRKDAVYQGSLHNIPLFTEDNQEYHRQIINVENKKTFFEKIAEQIDLSLLKDLAFCLFAISNFLTSLGFNVPYNFANDLASDAKVIEHQRHFIIMTIGISNCFGRVVIGYLGDRSVINRLTLYNTTLIIAGLATMAAPFCNSSVVTHMIYAALFGFFSGGYVGLTSIIIVDLVGLDKLSHAFGVLLLFQGVAVAIGTPVVGRMRDLFKHRPRPYLWPYLIFGGSILLSGLMLFLIPIIRRRKEDRQQPTKHQLDMGVLSFSKQNLASPDQQQQQQQI